MTMNSTGQNASAAATRSATWRGRCEKRRRRMSRLCRRSAHSASEASREARRRTQKSRAMKRYITPSSMVATAAASRAGIAPRQCCRCRARASSWRPRAALRECPDVGEDPCDHGRGGDHDVELDRAAQLRQDHVPQPLPPARAVDPRGLERPLVLTHQPGQEQHDAEADLAPDDHDQRRSSARSARCRSSRSPADRVRPSRAGR